MNQPYYSHAAVGQLQPAPPARDTAQDAFLNGVSPAYTALALTGTALGAYHGYKRNNSVGWAIAWAVLGGAFPFIAIPVALAQGVGKRGPK